MSVGTVTRAGREVLLECEDGTRIHLRPERAEPVAAALLEASVATGVARVVLQIQRQHGVQLVVAVRPTTGEVGLGNMGPFGEQYTGWTQAGAGEAAEEIRRLVDDIRSAPRRGRTRAA